MFSKWLGAKKPFKALEVASEQIHLLGEPEGNGTAVLKTELTKILVSEGNAAKAYLSRVRYGDETQVRLALIVDGRAPAAQMAAVIAQACQPLVAIDILFSDALPATALEHLKASVSPFFPAQSSNNQLFMINIQVGRGSNEEMPSNMAGAYVPVYVAAENSEAAAIQAVKHLSSQGYEFLDVVDKKIHQLDPAGWGEYVTTAWPDYQTQFPSQEDVIIGISFGRVFFGPFAGYDRQNA